MRDYFGIDIRSLRTLKTLGTLETFGEERARDSSISELLSELPNYFLTPSFRNLRKSLTSSL